MELKDVYHSPNLIESSKTLCGIVPYFGSAGYLYEGMLLGLNATLSFKQFYFNEMLESLQSRKHFPAIMDDLLIHSSRKSHMSHLEDLKFLCKMFRKDIANTIFTMDERVCVKPFRLRLKAIQKLKLPVNAECCKGFEGLMNYCSKFCLEF